LTIETEKLKNCVVVHLSGEMTIQSADELEEEISVLLSQGASHFVLDLDKLEFLDSRGAAKLNKLSQQYNGDLVFAAIPVNIREVLERLMLAERFTIYKTVEKATGQVLDLKDI